MKDNRFEKFFSEKNFCIQKNLDKEYNFTVIYLA